MNIARWSCCEARCCEYEETTDVEVVSAFHSADLPNDKEDANVYSVAGYGYKTCPTSGDGEDVRREYTDVSGEPLDPVQHAWTYFDDGKRYERETTRELMLQSNEDKSMAEENISSRDLRAHGNKIDVAAAHNENRKAGVPAPRSLARAGEDEDTQDRRNKEEIADADMVDSRETPLPFSNGLATGKKASPEDAARFDKAPAPPLYQERSMTRETSGTWILGPDEAFSSLQPVVTTAKLSL